MHINCEDFVAYAATLSGAELKTIGGQKKGFTISLTKSGGLRFTPTQQNDSSKKARPSPASKGSIVKVLSLFNRSNSFVTTHYLNITGCSSYLLSLIKSYQEFETSTEPVLFEKFDEDFWQRVKSSSNFSDRELRDRALNAPLFPASIVTKTLTFARNHYVTTFVLRRAAGSCENCGCPAPFLKKRDGEPYLEVHHKIRLADHGEDTIDNAIALCPNCHRKSHFGVDP